MGIFPLLDAVSIDRNAILERFTREERSRKMRKNFFELGKKEVNSFSYWRFFLDLLFRARRVLRFNAIQGHFSHLYPCIHLMESSLTKNSLLVLLIK